MAALILAAPASAASQCQLVKYLELPVQMTGARPIVTTKIGGKDARFILDSGAFFSTMSRASAAEYQLVTVAAPARLHLRGINGETSADMTTVREFELGGVKIPQVQFIVGGTDTGQVGLLGQNFLSMFDVEYDFPHGMLRLFRAKNCPDAAAAYWAGQRPVTVLPLIPVPYHTVATVTLNGVKLKAGFDSGAPLAGLTLSGAKHAGLTPQSPGVTEAGYTGGIGSKTLKQWVGTFDKIDIGGEAIPHPRIHFADMELGDFDMLIGFDFFLTHRILVENNAGRMLVTYEGGPMFGLKPTGVRDAGGAEIALDKPDAAPTDAEGFARRGGVSASGGKLEAAIADFDQAVALAPGNARYLKMRAAARMANRQPLLALADYEKVIAIDPADPDPHVARANLRLVFNDPKGAAEDIAIADKTLPPSSEGRLMLGGLFDTVEQYPQAIANFDQWLKFHPEDERRPVALNGRCWARALLNQELDKALTDCNAAIRARPNAGAYLDSRALVRLRRGELALAKADYDAALALTPRNALALYARGLVRGKLGDAAGAETDRAAALAIQPAVAARAKRLGLE
ncbi:tetratricopeptide (TPR) repeat protein/predicted aspartyl protease [Sphingomonas vulcanisoli]|uniref:Tetratricopeptide (TPR) repeat protein/predicted aspartyl protease n=1 Tax=Sphingomonas vulcanisoli TaxID=1658060 RepID=A0ABX0TS07_9SPHN|nr:aspartyl protease family protein [Sphingomonas vulcanisoli]NIJ07863.1 tetratricopeptide (TPR) repeat protein/predicted aspartyl protease [Sphingomonas vulcanisoli]